MTAPHGPDRCHRRYCRETPCIDAARDYAASHQRHRTRMIAYGRWEPFVDAEPVREHIATLRDAGIGIDRLPVLAGLARRTIRRIAYQSSVRAETAAKVLAVKPDLALCAAHALVDATGTRRRLQALQTLGWSQRRLADLMDTVQPVLGRTIRGEQTSVTAATALRARSLYDRLWDQAPPARTRREQQAATNARRAAATRGWLPPLAWDDDTIDDPAAVPYADEVAAPSEPGLPSGDELLWLVRMGETDEALAQRFNSNLKAVRQARYRAEKKEAAAA